MAKKSSQKHVTQDIAIELFEKEAADAILKAEKKVESVQEERIEHLKKELDKNREITVDLNVTFANVSEKQSKIAWAGWIVAVISVLFLGGIALVYTLAVVV